MRCLCRPPPALARIPWHISCARVNTPVRHFRCQVSVVPGKEGIDVPWALLKMSSKVAVLITNNRAVDNPNDDTPELSSALTHSLLLFDPTGSTVLRSPALGMTQLPSEPSQAHNALSSLVAFETTPSRRPSLSKTGSLWIPGTSQQRRSGAGRTVRGG